MFNNLEVASKLLQSKHNNDSLIRPHFRLIALGLRKDGALVKSVNSPSQHPDRKCHAEYKLCKKMDFGGEIYVARVLYQNNQFGMARPCPNCQKVIKSRGIKKVYYTIDKDSYGVWHTEKDKDTFHKC